MDITHSADGIAAPVQLHGYIMSQRETRWPIQKRVAWISSQYDLLFSHSSGYGQNVERYTNASNSGEFTAGDVDRCKITLEHVDSILTELSHNKNKGINLHAGVCI